MRRHTFLSPDGGGASVVVPKSFSSGTDAAEWAAKAATVINDLTKRGESTDAAVEKLSAEFRAAVERGQTPVVRERDTTGGNLRDFVGAKGIRFGTNLADVKFNHDSGDGVDNARKGSFGGLSYEEQPVSLFESAPVNEWHKDFLRANNARVVVETLMGQPSKSVRSKMLALMDRCPDPTLRSALEAHVKAVTNSSGVGAEWFPSIYSTSLYEDYRTPNRLMGLLGSVEVPKGSLVVPTISDTIRPYLKGQINNDDPQKYTASSPSSSSVTITPTGTAARLVVDDGMVEDSVFALLPELQARLMRALEDGYEDAMINGDTAASHQDAIASWN